MSAGVEQRLPITESFATWSSQLGYDQIDEADRAHAKMLLLDFLRACVIGSGTPSSLAARRLAASLGGQPTSTVLVFGDRVDAVRAALVNGSLAHATDIDDTHVASMLHPGAAVIPAALATAEMVGAEGPDLIAAIVAGYEVAIRTSEALQPAHFQRGFQATGTCGVLGAATAASRILGLDADQTMGAVGVAGSLAGGLAQFYYSGSEVKRVHAGLAAQNGVLAALFSREGVGGPHDVLEGQAGFAHAYADGFGDDSVVAGLGDNLAIRDIVLKPHATSARVQSAVEAVLDLLGEAPIDPAGVTTLEVDIPQVIAGRLTRPRPPDATAAQMSLPFTLALVLVLSHDRGAPITALSNEDYRAHLDDARVHRIADLTVCRVDAAISAVTDETGAVPANVSVISGDGVRRTRYVPMPRGAPARPLTREEHHELFLAGVGTRMDRKTLDIVIAAVENIEDPGALRDIAQRFVLTQRTFGISERTER